MELAWGDVFARRVTPAFRPRKEESYIDPEAMLIPVGSEGGRGSLEAGSQGTSGGQNTPFNGFTYNKNFSPMYEFGARSGASPPGGMAHPGDRPVKDSSYSSQSSTRDSGSPRGHSHGAR